jgi:hypothetical protein
MAAGVRRANPDLPIAVLLNARTATELAGCVAAVDEVFTVELGLPFDDPPDIPLQHIPRDWDYVLTDHRASRPTGWTALDRFNDAAAEWLRPRHTTEPERRDGPLHIGLPPEAHTYAEDFLDPDSRPRIAVVPSSGSWSKAPTERFWTMFCERLFDTYPRAEVVLIGSTDATRSVSQLLRGDFAERTSAIFPAVRNGYDHGLLNQLAIAQRCDAFVSPHTGIGFAMHALKVPWLCIESQMWPVYFLDDAPYLGLYPECPLFPCDGRILPECDALQRSFDRTLCLQDDAVLGTIPKLIELLGVLIDGGITPAESSRLHRAELQRRGVDWFGFGSAPDDHDWPQI